MLENSNYLLVINTHWIKLRRQKQLPLVAQFSGPAKTDKHNLFQRRGILFISSLLRRNHKVHVNWSESLFKVEVIE